MEKIVVLGAGFGGVRVALDLVKKLPNEKISLVNDSPVHTYVPDIYELTTIKLDSPLEKNYLDVLSTVSIPLKMIFKNRIDLIIDCVLGIDLPKKEVKLKSGDKITYDYLVIGLGSTTCYYHIPGAWEYSHPLKSAEDALNIRDDLSERLSSGKKTNVVIAGGGFTGVELAGNLSKFLSKKGSVTVLEGMDKVLNGMPDWAQEKALSRLKSLNVLVKLGFKIDKVSKTSVVSQNKETLDFDYLIWTTGVEGRGLRSGITGNILNKKNQLSVAADLSLENYPQVFVCGDMAEVKDSRQNSFAPPVAWAAIAEGKLVARNIVLSNRGEPTQEFIPPSPVFVVPIGSWYAISNAFDKALVGFFPWILKSLISLRYFWSILSPLIALKLWVKGIRELS